MSKSRPASPVTPWWFFLLQLLIAIAFSVASARLATYSQTRDFLRTLANAPTPEGRLFLQPEPYQLNSSSKGRVDILTDTDGTAINSVEVTVRYRSDLVNIDSIGFTQSVCSVIIEQYINPVQGTVQIACGLPFPGVNTQIGTVATLYYTAKTSGVAAFQIDPANAQMLANDGTGSNILRYIDNATVTINAGTAPTGSGTTSGTTGTSAVSTTTSATPAPTTNRSPASPSSGSSPGRAGQKPTGSGTGSSDDGVAGGQGTEGSGTRGTATTAAASLSKVPVINLSLAESSLCVNPEDMRFTWLKEPSAEYFEYELNEDARGMVAPARTTETALSLNGPAGKTLYFHIRAVAGNVVSQPGIVSVTTCPEGYRPPADEPAPPSMRETLADATFHFFKRIGEFVYRLFVTISN
jgi:hypothetical protein